MGRVDGELEKRISELYSEQDSRILVRFGREEAVQIMFDEPYILPEIDYDRFDKPEYVREKLRDLFTMLNKHYVLDSFENDNSSRKAFHHRVACKIVEETGYDFLNVYTRIEHSGLTKLAFGAMSLIFDLIMDYTPLELRGTLSSKMTITEQKIAEASELYNSGSATTLQKLEAVRAVRKAAYEGVVILAKDYKHENEPFAPTN